MCVCVCVCVYFLVSSFSCTQSVTLSLDLLKPFSFKCSLSCLLLLICRALADQLEGNEEEHKKYRGMVVEYIMVHGF